ncbi:MAG: hypothetical protein WCI73_09435 [Phycisphaerae bacterium]
MKFQRPGDALGFGLVAADGLSFPTFDTTKLRVPFAATFESTRHGSLLSRRQPHFHTDQVRDLIQ